MNRLPNVRFQDSGDTPCGCFLNPVHPGNLEIQFDLGGAGCGNKGQYENVCRNIQETGVARDAHGKLISNDRDGFSTAEFVDVMHTADSCMADKVSEISSECLEKTNNVANPEYYKCKVEARQNAIEDCDRFGPIQKALELVFGEKTSPGFICGIKEAVVNEGVAMPGTCCLDAPYELDGDHWGQRKSTLNSALHCSLSF